MIIAHTGDLQLGFRQYGLEVRRKAFEKAFLGLTRNLPATGAEALVIAGDLFEKDVRASSLEEMVRGEVRFLASCGIKTMGIEGNHDAVGDGSTLRVCDIEPLGGKAVSHKGVVFSGIDYCGKTSGDLRLKLAETPPCHVLALHLTLEEAFPLGADISARELSGLLASRGVKYVALGHLHGSWLHHAENGIVMAYSGSLEMTDIDESPSKSFWLVDLDPLSSKPPSLTSVTVPSQPIVREILDTEEDCLRVMEEARTRTDALYYLSIDRKLAHMVSKMETSLRGRGVAVTVKSHSRAAGAQGRDIKPFERAAMSAGLSEITEEVLGKGSEEAALARELAETPDRLTEICDKFLRNNGNGKTETATA